MKEKKFLIGNDHGGFELKMVLFNYLKGKGIDIEDIGTHSKDIVRYPYYAAKIANEVAASPMVRGILICSTGIGMSIVANKFKGVRAALCYSAYQGKMTSAHNNSNILCLGGACISEMEAIEIVEAWLNAEYEGGRHDISLGLIEDAEMTNFSTVQWKPTIPKDQ